MILEVKIVSLRQNTDVSAIVWIRYCENHYYYINLLLMPDLFQISTNFVHIGLVSTAFAL